MSNPLRLHFLLLTAVTEYDTRQSRKPASYNMYALPMYIKQLSKIQADVIAGASIRSAILMHFHGRLADACLKAVGEPRATKEELRGW